MSLNQKIDRPRSPETNELETKYFYSLKLKGDKYDVGYVQFSNQFRLLEIKDNRVRLVFKDDSETQKCRVAANILNPKLDIKTKIHIPENNRIINVELGEIDIDYNLNKVMSDGQTTANYRVLDRKQCYITIQTDSNLESIKKILEKLDEPKEITVPRSETGRTYTRSSKIYKIQDDTIQSDPLYKLKPINRITIRFTHDDELRDFIMEEGKYPEACFASLSITNFVSEANYSARNTPLLAAGKFISDNPDLFE